MSYYKLTTNNKTCISNIPIFNENSNCVEITEDEYQRIKQDLDNVKNIKIQLNDYYSWFCGYYAQHEQKYRRLISLNILCDDGSNPNNKLLELYKEAENKRKRIQELEILVKE